MMKLVFASSPSHDILKRHVFLGTLCDPWDLIELRFHGAGSGSFGTVDYDRVVLERVSMALDVVRCNPGELVLFSDVDIQWFRPAQEQLKAALEGSDVVFQRERPDRDLANCGFVCVRCNESSVAYFAALAKRAEEGMHDQQSTNEMIAQGRMPCRFGFLPSTFFNDNHQGKSRPEFSDLVMYHTIGTFASAHRTSVQIKLERHLSMRAAVLGSSNILRPPTGGAHVPPTKPQRYKPTAVQTKACAERK